MEGTISIRVNGKRYAVPYEEIIYMEKNLRRIRICTKKGDILFYGKYCDVMPLLDERFCNCHRSYVFNMDEIRYLSEEAIVMSNDETFRFGNKCYHRLKRTYENYISEPEQNRPQGT